MTYLSLEASKKVSELVGEYETEKTWMEYRVTKKGTNTWRRPARAVAGRKYSDSTRKLCPAPTFAELIRVLPRIQDKLKSNDSSDAAWNRSRLVTLYEEAPTEPEGMAQVEKYLMSLL